MSERSTTLAPEEQDALTFADGVEDQDIGPYLIRDLAAIIRRLDGIATDRHYVCEAHVPLGEIGNHDSECPCCEAVALAAQVEALRAMLDPESVEQFCRALSWSVATDDEKTLVIGNIRNFAAHLRAALVSSPETPHG